MRKLLIVGSTLLIAACNITADAREGDQSAGGAGQMTQRSYDLAGFDSVSVAGPHDVIVRVGGGHSVRAEGDSEVLDKLDIRVEDGKLQVGMKRGRWNFRNRAKTIVHVTLPAIRGAAIAGSGDMRIDRVEGDQFAASIGGSGDIEIAALRAGTVNFNVAGSGNIRASGNAASTNISIAGSGNIDLGAVEARTANVSIVGSGDVRARAMETADVSVMGSGDVEISGTARCSVNKMGSGSVRCGG